MALPDSPTHLEEIERYKRTAAQAAAQLVFDGARVGLGTGSTVAHLLPALAARELDLRCVATSLPRAPRGSWD
jgi:ribose 5-phosphate isomerase A